MCIDCVDTNRAIKVLEHCKSKVDFGAVKLLTSLECDYEHSVEIMPLHSLIMYSVFMLTKVHEYIDTTHVLIVQRDGWILNAESWDAEWLKLYYIGPLFMQYDKVGSGGFSLRQKGIMERISESVFWDGTEFGANELQASLNYYEDGIISFSNGFKIASLEQAANFAQGGNRNPKYFREKPFGFHRTWQEIDFKTGRVDSSDLTKDIKVTYNQEIDAL
jgi:hypothetical protein